MSLRGCAASLRCAPVGVALIVIAFMVGSIPFGYLIGRARGIDIRAHGSGNIGATNVTRVLGRRLGRLCFTLDVLKGLLPSLGAGLFLGDLGSWAPATPWLWIAAALAPIAGHVFCPWLGFKGGKGVATGLGALLGLFPVMAVAGAAALAVWVVAIKVWRYVSLASIVAGGGLPLWVGLALGLARLCGWIPAHELVRIGTPFVGLSVLLAGFVVYTHRSNIRRLRSGTEPRVGGTRPKAD